MCKACLEVSRKVSKDNHAWYIKNGYCYRCGKERVFGDEKTCPECRVKNYISMSHSRNTRYGNAHNFYIARREKYLSEGRCVRCGKVAVEGLKYCKPCLDREKERNRRDRLIGKDQEGNIPRSERFSYGLCYRCGKPLDTEKKLCSACCKSSAKNFKGIRSTKAYWRLDNKRVFGGAANG